MADPIRQAIKLVMESVADVGIVHGYERYSKRMSALRDLYKSNNQIKGWFIRRSRKVIRRDGPDKTTAIHWQIHGFWSLEDDSGTEEQMADLVDLLINAFDEKPDLDGVVTEINDGEQYGLSQDDSGPVMFAGVLCNSVRLSLVTIEREFCQFGGYA